MAVCIPSGLTPSTLSHSSSAILCLPFLGVSAGLERAPFVFGVGLFWLGPTRRGGSSSFLPLIFHLPTREEATVSMFVRVREALAVRESERGTRSGRE